MFGKAELSIIDKTSMYDGHKAVLSASYIYFWIWMFASMMLGSVNLGIKHIPTCTQSYIIDLFYMNERFSEFSWNIPSLYCQMFLHLFFITKEKPHKQLFSFEISLGCSGRTALSSHLNAQRYRRRALNKNLLLYKSCSRQRRKLEAEYCADK